MAQTLTWRAELTCRAGPQHGCDVALRPRGRAAHGPREAQVTRTCGRRPRGSTRVHADTREGRHVARRAGSWRAHGLVGPNNRIGTVTQ